MNKNIELFANDVMVVEETIKTFEAILTEAGTRDRFQRSLNALREIDDNTFNKFKSVVEVLYTMSRTENAATFSSAFSAVAFEDTSVADNLFSSIIPTTGLLTTFNEYERQAEVDAFKSKEEAPTKEDRLESPAEEEIVKPEPLHVPDEDAFVYEMPDNSKYKFERVFYYPKTGKFFGEYSGELQPKMYSNGTMCVYIKKFTHKWEELKTKLVFVKEILDKCGAMPSPKITNKGRWVLSFANGNRLDFRLANLIWTHGSGRTKMSRDKEYLKRIIRDALDKLGSEASASSVFNFLNKEKEVISVHMVGKLLPIVKKEVQEKEEALKEALAKEFVDRGISIAADTVKDSETDVMEYISEWKRLFKHYPSKENITDIRKYLTEQGYIKDDFSPMAVKDTIKLLTGISLSLKDVM